MRKKKSTRKNKYFEDLKEGLTEAIAHERLGKTRAHTADNKIERVREKSKKIPKREQWLFDNPEALASVRRGIADAKAGRIVKGPAYAKRKK